jgi:hypothetical protein
MQHASTLDDLAAWLKRRQQTLGALNRASPEIILCARQNFTRIKFLKVT